MKPGNKYYFTRNQSALLAFIIPQKWKQGAGVSIVATHVDSPNLRVSGEYEKLKNSFNFYPPRFVPSRNAPSLATSKSPWKHTVEESGTHGLIVISLWQAESSPRTRQEFLPPSLSRLRDLSYGFQLSQFTVCRISRFCIS